MPRCSNHQKSQRKAPNQKLRDRSLSLRGSDKGSSNNSHSNSKREDHRLDSPAYASRGASYDRVAQSLDSATLGKRSPVSSGPASPLHNHDNIDGGSCYCLKITIYKTTCKGRQPLPARLWTPHNIKHIMRDDLELAVVEVSDNISLIAFTEMGSCGAGLTKEEARACQEGFTRYMDWQGLTVEREMHPLTIEEATAEIDHHCHEVCGDHRSPRTPMGLQESPAAFSTQSQRSLRSPNGDRSEARTPHDKNNSASIQQIYASPRRRRHQQA